MGSFGVVMFPPSFDDDLGFAKRVEDFAVQKLVAHSPVETFAVSVLRISTVDVSRSARHMPPSELWGG